MVSSYVYDICKEYLDKFLFDFDRSQLSMSILSGSVTLRDVNLRPEELNDFLALNSLPFTLKAGFASKLNLTFSVISFHSQPIEIEFDNLALVFGPSLHHMSHDTSFLQKKRDHTFSHRSDQMGDDESESSYDSTNAFNIHQHNLKNTNRTNLSPNHPNQGIGLNNQAFDADDPLAHLPQHKTWKEHQKFLQKLRVAQVREQRNKANKLIQGTSLDSFDFNTDEILGGGETEDQNSCRSTLNQIQLKINGLHIRFEEDYFSADKPYSIGLIADQLNLYTTPQGKELWHFPEFLQSIFDTRPAQNANTGKQTAQGATGSQDDQVYKDIQLQNCQVYVNSQSQIYIPTQMYEDQKYMPMQIFETLSLDYLFDLMSKRQGLNFVIEPVDLIANFGDTNGIKMFFNLICGKIKLNVSEPVLTTFLTFKIYLENITIIKRLKQYRPQRRPLTASALREQFQGQDIQELPENIRRKRRLLVRDWFYYAIWYVRLRNVERKKPTAWDRLCKAQLAHDPNRYRDLIRSAADGMQAMREWLAKEQHIRRLEQKERNELKSEFTFKNYSEVVITTRIEQLNVQLYEKVIQVGIGLPLYDIKVNTIAYEKHLERKHKKLGSRLAAGQVTIKQVNNMDIQNEVSFNNFSRPMSAQRGSPRHQSSPHARQNVLSQLLSNNRKMTQLNMLTGTSAIQSPQLDQSGNTARQSHHSKPLSMQSLLSKNHTNQQIIREKNKTFYTPNKQDNQSRNTLKHHNSDATGKSKIQAAQVPSMKTKPGSQSILGVFGSILSGSRETNQVAQNEIPDQTIQQREHINSESNLNNSSNNPMSFVSNNANSFHTLTSRQKRSGLPTKPQPMINRNGNRQNKVSTRLGSTLQSNYQTTGNALQQNRPSQAFGGGTARPNSNKNAVLMPKGDQVVGSPQIIHQTSQPEPSMMRNRPSVQLPRAQINLGPTPVLNRNSPIRQEDAFPRGSRFLNLLEIRAPKNPSLEYLQQGGLPGCCLDILFEVPRFNQLDRLAPLECLPQGLVSLKRHIKVGALSSQELHSDQLLEGLTKLFTNYAWCIEEIGATPSAIEPLFSIEMADFEDTFSFEMQMHVIKKYLSSSKADKHAQVKKKKSQHMRQRSVQSNTSQVMDGVTTFESSANHIRRQFGITVPTMGLHTNPLSQDRDRENSGEENLTDEAIKEIDYDCPRVNATSRGSPLTQHDFTQQELRDITAARERLNLVNDSPLLKAMFELIPRNPVDFRVVFAVHEAKVAVFSSFVPIMRVSLTAPSQVVITKENQMSSLQFGALQTYFMSEPEMLFAFVKTLNAHLQGIFNTQMLRQEQNLLKLRAMVSNQLKIDHKVKKATIRGDDARGASYNMRFMNLVDEIPSEQKHQRNATTSALASSVFEEQDKLPPTRLGRTGQQMSFTITNTSGAIQANSPSMASQQEAFDHSHNQSQLAVAQQQSVSDSRTTTPLAHNSTHHSMHQHSKQHQQLPIPTVMINTSNTQRPKTTHKPNTNSVNNRRQPNKTNDPSRKGSNGNPVSSQNAFTNLLRSQPRGSGLEPLHDPSQNKRGAFQLQRSQQQLHQTANQPNSNFEGISGIEESKRPLMMPQPQNRNSQKNSESEIQPPKVSTKFLNMEGKSGASAGHFAQQEVGQVARRLTSQNEESSADALSADNQDPSCIDYMAEMEQTAQSVEHNPSNNNQLSNAEGNHSHQQPIRRSIFDNSAASATGSTIFPPNSFN